MCHNPAPDKRIALGEIAVEGHGDHLAIVNSVSGCKHVLIVDECRRAGSQSEALMAESGVTSFARVTAEDSFIATGPAYPATLPSADGIVEAAVGLVTG